MTDKDKKYYQRRYEDFVWTLEQCGVFLTEEDDITIGNCIFENFDIGVRSALSDVVLEMLKDNFMICEEISVKCVELRNKTVGIFDRDELRNINAVKNAAAWREVLELSDEIKSMLYY